MSHTWITWVHDGELNVILDEDPKLKKALKELDNAITVLVEDGFIIERHQAYLKNPETGRALFLETSLHVDEDLS